MQVLNKKVLSVRLDGCKRPRRVYDVLCQYLDVPHRGEIILEMEPYVVEDLRELAESEDKYDAETRRISSELADVIAENLSDFDYLWLTY
ncbi:MAG: hypothetical protein GXO69_05915 [Acidobacteria bacterium]|nr:hypothetical protein [Acidobacteriota bacterium]